MGGRANVGCGPESIGMVTVTVRGPGVPPRSLDPIGLDREGGPVMMFACSACCGTMMLPLWVGE